jgi:hypothetical protein
MINDNAMTLCITVPHDIYHNNIEKIKEQINGIMILADDIAINIVTVPLRKIFYYNITIGAAIRGDGRNDLYRYLKQIQDIMEENCETNKNKS